ncbi:hypothetical protein DPX16_3888 [Anabarilius grahami]|uniref:Uncharacterized protein n=1 Tax=Anabarilius grahami TaxID=495550 RepID=A0A3N0Z8G0_ANAGA|nr:hypothetical protein DPX16_3888 [Anabarilius grahami]
MDLTGDNFEVEPTTNKSTRVRRHDSTGNFCQTPPLQQQIKSSSEPVDLVLEASEQPGLSSASPPNKRRNDGRSSPAPRKEINCDRRVGADDEDASTVRGRQTPYPFHNVSEGKEEQQEKERGGAQRNHKLVNKIDTLTATINRLAAVLAAELNRAAEDRKRAAEDRNRMAREIAFIRNRLDLLDARIQEERARSASEFGAVHNRLLKYVFVCLFLNTKPDNKKFFF